VDGAAQVGCDLKKLLMLAAVLSMTVRADSYFLTIAGLGGEPEFDQRFTEYAKSLDKILRAEAGAKVDTLSGADATKANLEAKLKALAQTKPDDQVVVMLIGHGTFDDREYKLALPGPDISASELSQLLDKIPARQLIVDMTTSSGGAIPILQKNKRVIIAATKAGTEKSSVAIFPRYWIEALQDPATDADKNDVISALEAFRYAQAKVTKFFETQNRLATEHAVIEDTGKGDGVKDPSTENGEGRVANSFALVHLGASAKLAKDPAKQKLLKHLEDLDAQLDELKYEKASKDAAQYRKELQTLMIDRAQTQEELDK
jgi:peptidase C13-like protein